MASRATHVTAVDIGGGILGYTDGDPGSAIPATVLTALERNQTQEEVAKAVEHFGLTPDGSADDQLATGLDTINDSVWGPGTDGTFVTVGNYTQTSDEYYEALTLSAGHGWFNNGYRLFVNGTLRIEGTFRVDGDDGLNVGPSPPAGGDGAPHGSVGGGGNGGDGGIVASSNGVDGAARAQAGTFYMNGAVGLGDGGDGTDGNSTTGGAGGQVVLPGNQLDYRVYPQRMQGIGLAAEIEEDPEDDQFSPQWRRLSGGSGGAGGGASTDGDGTGGGGGGGVMIIMARHVIINGGQLNADGGEGPLPLGAPNLPGRGGGGGGGVILLTYRSLVFESGDLADIHANGGAGGVPGEDGVVHLARM